MLTSLEIFSTRVSAYPFGYDSDPLPVLPLGPSIETDPLQIIDIEGLGPVPAAINTSTLGNIDGDVYLGSSVSKRNIVLTLRVNPDWVTTSVESIRNMLYTQFMPKTKIRMKFVSTHLPPVDIAGYVETVTPNLFAKDPEYQISIICPEPSFRAVDETYIVTTTDAPEDYTISYDGTVDAGLRMDISLGSYAGPVPTNADFFIFHTHPTTDIFVMKHLTFAEGDVLTINTVPGQKYARILQPNGLKINVVQKITTASTWPILTPGDNIFNFVGLGNLELDLRYRRLYGGL